MPEAIPAKPPDVTDDGPVRAALDPTQRAGLLTHGSVLAFYAHAAQSSPVSRGVMIRKSLLCQDLPAGPCASAVLSPRPTRIRVA